VQGEEEEEEQQGQPKRLWVRGEASLPKKEPATEAEKIHIYLTIRE
jgi:hypothetical protein